MNCPSCSSGVIRVVPGIACACGHPALVCDRCEHRFAVKHNGRNSGLLPPEAELDDIGPFYPQDFVEKAKEDGVPLPPLPFCRFPTIDELHELIELFGGVSYTDICYHLEGVRDGLKSKISNGQALTEKEELQLKTAERWLNVFE